MAGIVEGPTLANLVGMINFGGGRPSTGVSTLGTGSTPYQKVKSPKKIGKAILDGFQNKKKLTSEDGVQSIYGKSSSALGMSFINQKLKELEIPLEVDCDPKMSSAERLSNTVGGNSAASMSQCTILDVIGNLDASKEVLGATAVIKGVQYAVRNKDLKTALGISSMIDKLPSMNNRYLSKAVGYFDLETELAFAKRIMSESLRIDLQGVVDLLLSNATSDLHRKRLLLEQVRMACMRSYLDKVQMAIDECGVGAVRDKVPDAVPLILRHYRYRGGKGDHLGELAKVKALLTQLSPGWANITVGGQSYGNFQPFMSSSPDAQDLFLLDNDLYVHVLVGVRNGNESIYTLGKQMYPTISFRRR